jgi:hypothetical protein
MVAVRVTQFVSAIVSLVLYSIYISHVVSGSASADRAVVGIAAAASLWVIIAAGQYAWKHRGEKKGKGAMTGIAGVVIAVIAIDIAFIASYIASAAITGPSASGRGACAVMGDDDSDGQNDNDDDSDTMQVYGPGCGLQKATFALSVVNV